MQIVPRRNRRRSIAAFAIGLAGVLAPPLAASAAAATTVPAGTVVRMERDIDLTAFMRLVATRYHVTLRRVVVADIDRDGDLDVVGATDRGFIVWVNDGAGRLTSQSPQHQPAVDGRAPADTWSGGGPRCDETIQNDLPSPRLPSPRAPAPPSMVARRTALPDVGRGADTLRGACTPRAPPSTV